MQVQRYGSLDCSTALNGELDMSNDGESKYGLGRICIIHLLRLCLIELLRSGHQMANTAGG